MDVSQIALVELPRKFLHWLEERGVDLKPSEEPPKRTNTRPKLDKVTISLEGDRLNAEVAISLPGRSARANREGSLEHSLRLCAQATLDALDQLYPNLELRLDRAFLLALRSPIPGTEALAVVVLEELAGRGRFIGACRAPAHTPIASARATLDALNRQTQLFIASPR